MREMATESPPAFASSLKGRGSLALLLTGWLVPLTLLGYWRSARALVGAFDTGIYLQVLSNLFHHGDLASSVTGEQNFLAHHFQPIILLLAPLERWIDNLPYALLFVGFLLVAATAAGLAKVAMSFVPEGVTALAAGALFGFLAHPSVAGRLWYGFSPDIIAFPAFAIMAMALLSLHKWSPWLVLLAALWAGACKETFWLTDAAVLWAYFQGRGQMLNAALGTAACLAVFCLLFFWWMPAHSQLPSYYGLSYYIDIPAGAPPPDGWSLATAALHNLFSERSAATLLCLACMTCGLPFLGWHRCWIAALPGLLLILASRSAIVHHPANHYLLCVLPFLFGATLANLKKLDAWWPKRRRHLWRLAPFILGVVPLSYSLLMSGGIADGAALIVKNSRTKTWRRDAMIIRAHLPSDAPLVVDGDLQPIFADHRDTTVLLGFTGNPKRLSATELRSDLYVVTSENLKDLPDCNRVRVGGTELQTDIPYFERVCNRIREDGQLVESYPESGLVVFHLPKVGV